MVLNPLNIRIVYHDNKKEVTRNPETKRFDRPNIKEKWKFPLCGKLPVNQSSA